MVAATGVLAVAGLTGCTGGTGERRGRQFTADQRSRDRLLAEKRRLVAAYRETAEQHPRLAAGLASYIDRVGAHIEALQGALAATPALPGTASPADSRSATGEPAPSVPTERGGALQALAAAEEASANSCQSAAGTAGSGVFAALVASIAACGQAHAVLLRTEGPT